MKTYLSFISEVNFWRPLKTVVSCDLFIINNNQRVFTLYVGLADTAPPTNRLTFFLPRLQEALYGDIPV